MKAHLYISLLTAFVVCTSSAADVSPIPGVEVRGFIGVVIPTSPKQVATGDFRSVLSIVPKSPAEAAAIKPGDFILSVNGQSTAPMKSYLDLVHALQGPPDSTVRLELKRIETGQIETIQITRSKQLFSADFPK